MEFTIKVGEEQGNKCMDRLLQNSNGYYAEGKVE